MVGNKSNPSIVITDQYGNPSYSFGNVVSIDRAYSVSAVYACVKLFADMISTVDFRIYSEGVDQSYQVKEFLPPADRLQRLISNPSTYFDPAFWYRQFFADFVGKGNAYAYIDTSNPSRFELVYLPNENVTPLIAYHNPAELWAYQITHPVSGTTRIVSRSDVIHCKNISLDGGLTGASPIALNWPTIRGSIDKTAYGNNYYTQGARLSGVIETPKQVKRDDVVSFSEWFNEFNATVAGERVAFLPGGLTFKPTSPVTARDAELIAAQQLTTEEIAKVFRVPLVLLTDVSLNDAAYNSVMSTFVRLSVQPLLTAFESEFKFKILNPIDPRFKVYSDVSDLLMQSHSERYSNYEIGIRSGFLSPNEARVSEGLPPANGLSSFFFSSGTIAVLPDGSIVAPQQSLPASRSQNPTSAEASLVFDVASNKLIPA